MEETIQKNSVITSLKITNLRSLGGPAIDTCTPDVSMQSKFQRFLLNLHSQLSGRRKNQHDRTVTLNWNNSKLRVTQYRVVEHRLNDVANRKLT